MEKKINDILIYGKGFCGTSRGKNWKSFKKFSYDTAPFWIGDTLPPKKNIIKKNGVNCAGLINLLRRYAELPVSVVLEKQHGYAGTSEWFTYLNKKKRLKKFDINKSYPAGTMVLRNFNLIDSGHVGVIFKENTKGVLFSSLLHSVGWDDGGHQMVKIDSTVGKSYFHAYNGTTNVGHYTHICMPQDWLCKI
jgi:hypothetical protein